MGILGKGKEEREGGGRRQQCRWGKRKEEGEGLRGREKKKGRREGRTKTALGERGTNWTAVAAAAARTED